MMQTNNYVKNMKMNEYRIKYEHIHLDFIYIYIYICVYTCVLNTMLLIFVYFFHGLLIFIYVPPFLEVKGTHFSIIYISMCELYELLV